MKLTKDEGFVLLKSLLNHWLIKEHNFEDVEDYLDNYIQNCVPLIYDLAIKWEGGIADKEIGKFTSQQSISKTHRCFLGEFDRFDEHPDVDWIARIVLELTKTIILPHLDLEIKRKMAKVFKRNVSKAKKFFNCPVCEKENEYIKFIQNCRHCKVILDFEGEK